MAVVARTRWTRLGAALCVAAASLLPSSAALPVGAWHGPSGRPAQTSCWCHNRRLPVGAIFADGCNMCECMPYGATCTSKGCVSEGHLIGCWGVAVRPCAPGAACVYDPGCESPHSYPGGYIARLERPHCGCDGVTFWAVAPEKPYRHVGACP
jgi:hypothetical protein